MHLGVVRLGKVRLGEVSIRPSVHPSVHPSIRPSIRPSICPSVLPKRGLALPSACPPARLGPHHLQHCSALHALQLRLPVMGAAMAINPKPAL
eukprot:148385-Chlamydomonas_euryale.AAC.1